MIKKHEIFILSHHLGGAGGVQTFIQMIANQFVKDGHKVTVIGMSTQKNINISGVLENEKFKTVLLYQEDIFTTRPDKLFLDSFITKASSKKIQSLLNQANNPQVIIANPLCYLFFKDVDTSRCATVIGQMHSSAEFLLESKGMYGIYRYLIKKYYVNTTHFLMLTEKDAEIVAEKYSFKHMGAIANPIELPQKKRNKEKRMNRAIMLARLDKVKQIDHAIDIFNLFLLEYPNWKLDIYGDGPLRKQLQQQIVRLNREDQIKLKGYKKDVSLLLEKSDLMLLTSSKEGFPMSIMEAMAQQVPTIAYNCSPGVEELLVKTKGLVPLNNQKKFVERLISYAASEELLRNQAEIGMTVISQYTPEKIATKWYHFFDEK